MQGHQGAITAIAELEGNRLVTASADRTVKIWHWKDGTELMSMCRSILAFVLLADGRLASCSSEGNPSAITLWGVSEGEGCGPIAGYETGNLFGPKVELLGHYDQVACIASLPTVVDPETEKKTFLLASGSWDKTIKVWNTSDKKDVVTMFGHKGRVTALTALPRGRIASGSEEDTSVRIWDLDAAREIACLKGHGLGVNALAALDSGWIAMGSRDKVLRVWVQTQSQLGVYPMFRSYRNLEKYPQIGAKCIDAGLAEPTVTHEKILEMLATLETHESR